MIKRNILCLLSILALSQAAVAQSEEENVKRVVEQLFDGMREADSSLVSAVFATDVRMLTIVERGGKTSLREGAVADFLQAVGTPHDEVWDEHILDYEIRIDDQLATVWAPYRFYLGNRFSHCGVNAFQLYKSAEGWKIIQITDTRWKEPCGDTAH